MKKQTIELDHVYLDPDVYDLTHGRSNYEAAFDSHCMLDIIDRHHHGFATKLRALEIASGVYSRYEPSMQELLPHLTRLRKLDMVKTDFVGTNSDLFQVMDVCNEPMFPLGVDVVLAPYHTLQTLMDSRTFESGMHIVDRAVHNSATALRKGGFYLAHLGAGNGTRAHRTYFQKGEIITYDKPVPYTSLLRRYGTKCRITLTHLGLVGDCLRQHVELYFPETSTRIKVKHPFDLVFATNQQVADVFGINGLELVQGYSASYKFAGSRDEVRPVKNLARADWMLFRKL